MELATEYILGKVLTLTDSIARRVFQKAGDRANSRFGPEGNQTLTDIMVAIEKETTQILDSLASQQQSKVDSAYQYIKFAMSDLQAWNDELKSPMTHYPSASHHSSSSDHRVAHVSPLGVSPGFAVTAPTSSKCFRDAIWQLRQADEWATEAFNDKKNSKAYVRIEALHIRLFCRALLDWDNKRLWFAKWRQVLEPFFSDRQFVRYAMGEQSFASRIFSEERAKSVSERLITLTSCLSKLIWGMLLRDPSLAPYAREFATYFDRNTTLAPDVRLVSNWTGLRTFHLTYYDLADDIELKLCADRLVVRLYEFKAITPAASGKVWAVEHEGRLVSFDSADPETQTLVTSDGKRWLDVGYAPQQGKLFATSEDTRHISVFVAATGHVIEQETYALPPGPTMAYAYRMRVTPSGAILFHDKGSGRGFIMFPEEQGACRKPKWLPLKTGDYHAVIDGVTKDEVVGLKLKGYYLHADVIKMTKGDSEPEAFITQTISERIFLPNEPQACLLATALDRVDTCSSYRITIACQTEKLNYMISVGVKVDSGAVVSFPVKDVSSFETKYTDWKMAREMVEQDGKLFILFR